MTQYSGNEKKKLSKLTVSVHNNEHIWTLMSKEDTWALF